MKYKSYFLLIIFLVFIGLLIVGKEQTIFADTTNIAPLTCASTSNTASSTQMVSQQQITATTQQASDTAKQQISSIAQNILNNIKSSDTYFIKQFQTTQTSSNSTGQTTGTVTRTTSGGSSSSPNSIQCPIINRNLKVGDSGSDVLTLSNTLVNEGLLATPTANFDSTVSDAVTAYQQKHASQILTPLGLSSGTGIVGASTRNYLNSHTNCSSPAGFLGSFRYLRIDMLRNEWLVLNEIEIYGATGSKITPASISASSVYANQSAQLAVDGNYDTYWDSGETNSYCTSQCSSDCQSATRSAYIVIDLGAVKNVSKIRLYDQGWINGEVVKISVSNSNDGSSAFAPMATFTNNSSCSVHSQWLQDPSLISSSCQGNTAIGPDNGSTPTPPVAQPATTQQTTSNSCPTFWWYDSQNTSCSSQKQFCGLNYEYKGLMVFSTQYSCQMSAQNSTKTKI